MFQLDGINFLILVAFIFNFILFILIFVKSLRRVTDLLFAGFIVTLILWEVVMILYRSAVDPTLVLKYAKFLYAVAALIPASFTLFTLYFSLRNSKYLRLTTCLTLVSAFLMFVICFWEGRIVKDVTNINTLNSESVIKWGSLYLIYVVYQNTFFSIGLGILFWKYWHSIKETRSQTLYILIGTSTAVSIAFITNLFLPSFNIFSLNWVGQVTTIVWSGFVTYAIIAHKLFDVQIALRKMLIHTFNTFSIFVFSSMIYVFYNSAVNRSITIDALNVILFGAFGLSFFVPFIDDINQLLIDKFFFKRLISRNKAIRLLAETVNHQIDINIILKDIHDVIKDALGLKGLKVVLEDQEGINIQSRKYLLLNDEVYLNFDKDIVHFITLLKLNDIFFIDELPINKVTKVLKELKVEVGLAIYDKNDVIGIILLNEKKSKDSFTKNDIILLNSILPQISAAIVKSKYYAAEKDYANQLKLKVNEATVKLRQQKDKLQEKYQFEKDMMGIMGHELRTPMTVAKGMAELVMAKNKTHQLDPEYVAVKTQKIYESIVKETELIQTMLSTSHVDNGKLNLQIVEVNIIEVLEYAVEAFQRDAMTKGLQFIYEKPAEKSIIIESDPNRVQEIVNNLVSNAVKYTNEGFVRVHMETDKDFVTVVVKDSGIGIPQSEIKNLGKKFYRIHQHLDRYKDVVRAGGTGLGLYVVKGVLDALGGKFDVKSAEGKGSTFSASFPIKPHIDDHVFLTKKPVDKNDMFAQMGLKVS